MVHPDNAPQYLPQNVELTEDERIALKYIRSFKSSYRGIPNYRFYEAQRTTQITLERWEAAKASLISKGLLNKAGALTNEGRNQSQAI